MSLLAKCNSRLVRFAIEIDNKLSWKQQIEKTKNKSIRTLNMVRRNFTKGTTTQIRNQIFTGLVRPQLEYGSNVWDPHQTTRIQLLERVQNKGARYVMQDWGRQTSVSQIKSSLGWCTLQERRLVNRLASFHKSVHLEHRSINICTHSCPAPLEHGTSCHKI